MIQFVILLVILYVLNRFVFKPYLAYLDEWEAKQKKVQEDYKNADAIIEEKQKQGDKMLEDARQKGNKLIEEAEALAKSKKQKIVSEAETAAQETKDLAQAEIQKERNSMLSDMKGNVIDMALRLNKKLFGEENVSREYLEKNIDSLK